jgi:hypothetical protein
MYSLAPAAYMYNGLLLSQAPTTMIAGYPTNAAPCAYFDYTSSFADPTHLTATINGAYTQTGLPNHHSQPTNNTQYASPDANQPLFAPISTTDLNGQQVYGFAPITRF